MLPGETEEVSTEQMTQTGKVNSTHFFNFLLRVKINWVIGGMTVIYHGKKEASLRPLWLIFTMCSLHCTAVDQGRRFNATARSGSQLSGNLQVWFYNSLWENDPTSNLSYYLSKLVSHEFMVSVSRFKSSSIQHDVHFVNYGPIYLKIDNKAVNTLERGYLVIQPFGSRM